MDKCVDLYQQSITIDASLDKEKKYKLDRNCLTKIKRKAKVDYYTKQCYALKSDTKRNMATNQ